MAQNTTHDWAAALVAQLISNGLVEDDATRAFSTAYTAGDSIEASAAMERAAVECIDCEGPNGYFVLRFADGSSYNNVEQGVERFYPSESYDDNLERCGLSRAAETES